MYWLLTWSVCCSEDYDISLISPRNYFLVRPRIPSGQALIVAYVVVWRTHFQLPRCSILRCSRQWLLARSRIGPLWSLSAESYAKRCAMGPNVSSVSCETHMTQRMP